MRYGSRDPRHGSSRPALIEPVEEVASWAALAGRSFCRNFFLTLTSWSERSLVRTARSNGPLFPCSADERIAMLPSLLAGPPHTDLERGLRFSAGCGKLVERLPLSCFQMTDSLWFNLQKELQQSIPADEFQTWFKPLRVRSEESKKARPHGAQSTLPEYARRKLPHGRQPCHCRTARQRVRGALLSG